MAKTKENDDIIVVTEVMKGSVDAVLVGESPLVLNRMSEKAKRILLLPSPRMTSADKAANQKHNPMEEFRASADRLPHGPTLLAIKASAPKKAIASAALDLPGSASKAKIGRLAWVPGEYLPVYGLPQIFMEVVRMKDINRTPDIRTRVIIARWAIPIRVNFVEPILNPTTIIKLLSAAGLYIGVGDGRNEKGSLTFGQFQVMSTAQAQKDKDVKSIFAQGRSEQTKAMANPEPYDDQTAELLSWFTQEMKTRGKKLVAA